MYRAVDLSSCSRWLAWPWTSRCLAEVPVHDATSTFGILTPSFGDTGIPRPGLNFSSTLLRLQMDVILLPPTSLACLIVRQRLPLSCRPASMLLACLYTARLPLCNHHRLHTSSSSLSLSILSPCGATILLFYVIWSFPSMLKIIFHNSTSKCAGAACDIYVLLTWIMLCIDYPCPLYCWLSALACAFVLFLHKCSFLTVPSLAYSGYIFNFQSL